MRAQHVQITSRVHPARLDSLVYSVSTTVEPVTEVFVTLTQEYAHIHVGTMSILKLTGGAQDVLNVPTVVLNVLQRHNVLRV